MYQKFRTSNTYSNILGIKRFVCISKNIEGFIQCLRKYQILQAKKIPVLNVCVENLLKINTVFSIFHLIGTAKSSKNDVNISIQIILNVGFLYLQRFQAGVYGPIICEYLKILQTKLEMHHKVLKRFP